MCIGFASSCRPHLFHRDQARHFYDDEQYDDEDEGAHEYENDDDEGSQYDGADGSDGYGGNPPTQHRHAAAESAEGRRFSDDQGEETDANEDGEFEEEYEEEQDHEAYLTQLQPPRQQQQQQQQRVAENDDDDEAEYEARYLAELAHEQRENVRLRAMVCMP